MTMDTKVLFTSFDLCGLTLRNRTGGPHEFNGFDFLALRKEFLQRLKSLF